MSLQVEFISAGAGSGKTFTLTEKLKELLANGEVQAHGVIATTFTRLASGELRERVRESLMEAGNVDLANQMGQASINTVNGVCGDLLKRFSFEAGLSPEQTVVEEGEAARLFGEAVDQVLSSNLPRIKKLNSLAHRLGFFDRGLPLWRDHVKSIADAARANDCELSDLTTFATQSSDGLLSHFRQPIKRDLDAELLSAVNTALAAIDLDADKTKKTKSHHDLLRGVCAALLKHRLTWTEWVKLTKSLPGAKSKAVCEPVQLIAEDYEAHPQLHKDIAEYTGLVFELAGDSISSYQQLKEQQGLVDFVDQESELYRLLEHPDVKEVLAEELQLLMVDEFQDTSPIQLALFARMAALAKKVIWVGDIKQAIYGFRGSDPSLMDAVLSAVVEAGGETKILERSWRSRPALVDYCNEIFAPAFENTMPRERVVLDPARKELSQDAAVIRWPLSGNMKIKMATIATGMKDLVSGGYQVVDKESGILRPVCFGDMAVLCRSNSRLAELADACYQQDISVSYKRAGLLATPESALVLACLRRLADPKDTLASAEIHALAYGESVEEWLPGRLTHVASEQSNSEWGEQNDTLLSSLAIARQALNSMTPVEAMMEAIAKGNVRQIVNQWGPTAQRSASRLANIDCMVALAANYEDHCDVRSTAATVPGLIMWLNELEVAEEDFQAVLASDDSVTLVTHHGAKGLEWPVVVAVDLEKEVRTRLWGLSVTARADGFDVARPLFGRSLRFWPFPFGKQATGIVVKDRIEASAAGVDAQYRAMEEEKRLLYVSLTRARDLLVLPLNDKGDYKSLNTLGADWMVPDGDCLKLPNGGVIPTKMESPETLEAEPSALSYVPHWLPSVDVTPVSIGRKFSPSAASASENSSVGKVVELGERLALGAVEDMATLGTALHGVIAADIVAGGVLSEVRAQQVLSSFGVSEVFSATDALIASRRFIDFIKSNYSVLQWLVEFPVSIINDAGQEANGFIDLMIETPDGWIIVDHKSSPAPRSDWEDIAIKHSGQLAAYSKVVTELTGKPVLSCWIHFAVTGGLVKVKL